jgi:hypothetical protein
VWLKKKVKFAELGGDIPASYLPSSIYARTNAVIFVLDLTAPAQVEEAKQALECLLTEDHLRGKPFTCCSETRLTTSRIFAGWPQMKVSVEWIRRLGNRSQWPTALRKFGKIIGRSWPMLSWGLFGFARLFLKLSIPPPTRIHLSLSQAPIIKTLPAKKPSIFQRCLLFPYIPTIGTSQFDEGFEGHALDAYRDKERSRSRRCWKKYGHKRASESSSISTNRPQYDRSMTLVVLWNMESHEFDIHIYLIIYI